MHVKFTSVCEAPLVIFLKLGQYQAIASCCPKLPSHYLNRCWPFIIEVLWYTHENDFTRCASGNILYNKSEVDTCKLPPQLLQRIPLFHGPLTRYANLQVAHAPGMPRTFSPPPAGWRPRHALGHVRNARAVMHAGIVNYFFSWSRGKRSRHCWCMRNPQFCVSVSGKRPSTQRSTIDYLRFGDDEEIKYTYLHNHHTAAYVA